MVGMPVDELGGEQVLARVGALHGRRRSADTEIFVLVAAFADIHNPDSRPSRGPSLPGMEKARRFGGAGTPAMWEFALGELAVQLECSTAAARYLVRDVLDVRHRLPDIWARVQAGAVRVHYARH